MERVLLKGPSVMDEQSTICDPYLFAIDSGMVREHGKGPLARPAVQTAVTAKATHIAWIAGFTPFSD